MLEIIPAYLRTLDPHLDRTRRMLEELGLSEAQLGDENLGAKVLITAPPGARAAQRLVTQRLVDLLVRLEPLVGTVLLDGYDDVSWIDDLRERFPVTIRRAAMAGEADVRVSIGRALAPSDIVVDAAGWVATFGCPCSAEDDGNPIGALAGAALAAGDVFKILFKARWPENRIARQVELCAGAFSFWDYSASEASPRLEPVELDAVLVGCGGVGSGVVCAFGALGGALSGAFRIVDPDDLDLYNLNRVTFGSLSEAGRAAKKAASAKTYLGACVPMLRVEAIELNYSQFKRLTPRREDRRYPLVLTGLDTDDTRHEVQMDLPRRLVDGATGAQFNCVVESVHFGLRGCLGCSRLSPAARPAEPEQCDAPPAPKAPSISFLSALAGTLVAAEAIKVSHGQDSARRFEHFFTYGLNPDLHGRVGFSPTCKVECQRDTVRAAFARKWPVHSSPQR
jgi:molybdopterin/thiamine biosynthesis adenylyltransferase